MTGEYMLVGASGAAVIIVVTVTGVIVKRVDESTNMDFSKFSEAFSKFFAKK
jgi:hypothetical protein